jgi:predicted 3-demethylubiquinone-9 3-methyltransferase (glyoxalase superfamily)
MATKTQGITPHLWFDNNVKQATEFYCSLFPQSEISNVTVLHDTPSDTPSGDTDIVTFTLAGQPFMAISAGPLFKFNPSISFIVNFDPSRDPNARENLDKVWGKLSEGGKALMPLQEYPFSKWFGWIEDKYGLSWQLMLTNPGGEERPFIIPALMFIRENLGHAEEAINFYLSVFKNTKMGSMMRYSKEMAPENEGAIQFADLMLEGAWFALMDSPGPHEFGFNESVSFIVNCEDQKSIDYYWEKLSAVPEAEQCGWLKDKFGVSWQITPTAMDEMLAGGTRAQIDRVTQAFLPMKKIIIADLEKAYKGGE